MASHRHEYGYKGHDLEQELLHSSIVSRILSLTYYTLLAKRTMDHEAAERLISGDVVNVEATPQCGTVDLVWTTTDVVKICHCLELATDHCHRCVHYLIL